ncbi:prolipoprotein diacylglyceryl transferase [Clostridium sp. DL1XJH146]
MNPIAFNLFGYDIRWYGILISIGILLGLLLAQIQCKYYEEDFDKVTDIFLVGLPIAIIGARLYYVIFSWSYYSQNPSQIINIRGGGLAIHGGIIGAALVSYFMSKHKNISFPRLLDIIAPSFLLGQTIGRWGNFMNGEAHGGAVTEQFISKFPEFIQKGMLINGTYYHPTFLYESIWNFLGLLILIIISRKIYNFKKGGIFAIYLIYYSIGRFFIEGLRTDQLTMGIIPIAQLVSVLSIIGGLAFLLLGNKQKSKYHL